MKQCGKCKQLKPLNDFPKNKSQKFGVHSYCRLCSSVYRKELKAKNPDIEKSRKLRQCFGITLAEKQQMIKSQNGNCLICETKLDNGLRTHVDHCHTSGKIRGILCAHCNHLLGHAKDSIEILQKAIQYLTINQQ